jgi:hypothetical protein
LTLIRGPFEAVVYPQTEVDERERRGSGCLPGGQVESELISKVIYENPRKGRLAKRLGAEHVITSSPLRRDWQPTKLGEL